ncbi:uncharacterized protein HMPREF1541_08133 [Cyphellophora europaea CBS 101466]|uniref:Transcription factor domain-containing protein n=1 Tax=Cyphellophora europaea (strain CBS 101466) TaxID=1220924 RepID=W2RN55_CYPE1|nr:uncharacterized protein HMPREF1541_08133 [Cyphellophora europaea CBS 101466]ETN37143.1 hypothetical protein HMPREF1541_08133 [Cyphellophora europaea CBS 101466]
MQHEQHLGGKCCCDQCGAQHRNHPPDRTARNKSSIASSRNTRSLHPARFSTSQQRKKHLLIDKLSSPPTEVIPADQRVSGPTPVNFFPVPRDSAVANSIQYYFEVFSFAIHAHKSDAPDGWQDRSGFQEMLQEAMSDPMWYCANVAFAEGMKDRTLYDSRKKTDIILKYQHMALLELRRRLLADKDTEVLLWTITILMALDVTFGSYESWKAHFEGLDRIISMRGGLESLNGNMYLKTKVIGFNTFWLYKQVVMATVQDTSVYPKHPFPAEVCIAISKLPRELGDLALDGCFNCPLISLAADVCALSKKFQLDREKKSEDLRRLKVLGYELEELLKGTGLKHLEQLVAAALVDYCVSMDTDRGLHWLLTGALRMRISHIWCKGVTYNKKHARAYVWSASMLTACGETSSLTFKLGSKVLDLCAERETLDRAYVLDICRQYIWDESLTTKLDSKLDFDSTPSDRPKSLSKSPSPMVTLPPREGLEWLLAK